MLQTSFKVECPHSEVLSVFGRGGSRWVEENASVLPLPCASGAYVLCVSFEARVGRESGTPPRGLGEQCIISWELPSRSALIV